MCAYTCAYTPLLTHLCLHTPAHTPVFTPLLTHLCSQTCAHTCKHTSVHTPAVFQHHPMGPQARLLSHRACLISATWWHRHTHLHAHHSSELPVCGSVGTLVHVLAVSAGPRGVCLPVCTPVSCTTLWRCRSACSHARFKSQQQHLAVQMFALLMSQSSKGTPESACQFPALLSVCVTTPIHSYCVPALLHK